MSQTIAANADSIKTSAGLALWRLGFRPFYLLASVFAALSIPLWALQFAGLLSHPYLAGPLWHAHEMLFGFVLAVIVGFLLTAGRNWAGRPTLRGPALMALAALWVAGRILVVTPYGWLAAVVNCAFPLAASVALAVPFFGARNKRNYFFIALLLGMFVAQLVFHLSQLQIIHPPPLAGVQIGLDVLLLVISAIAGRVIPLFTNGAIRGAGTKRYERLEAMATVALVALVVADAAGLSGAPLMVLLVLCGVTQAARWLGWRPWTTLRTPMVWVLHASYLWIVFHFGLRAAEALGLVGPSAAVHALAVGAAGGLIMGMMTRVARGHTGRRLRADGVDVTCYLLVLAAALVRVMAPLIAPVFIVQEVLAAAALWGAGFGLYALRYGPWLLTARADGAVE
jgi:uncharacterized protein involved in response to NO